MTATDYCRDPDEIYRRSFAAIRAEADLDGLPAEMKPIAIRLIHACGMTDLVDDLAWSERAVAAGRAALQAGAPILCDTRMVAEGIIRSRLPAECPILCTLGDDGVEARAKALGTTRSAASVDLWDDKLAGSVVAIGNAPTALFRLLERIAEGAPRPALIVAMPVGFIGAAEAKAAIAGSDLGLAFLTVKGRRGGSALAAAAVNALAGPDPSP